MPNSPINDAVKKAEAEVQVIRSDDGELLPVPDGMEPKAEVFVKVVENGGMIKTAMERSGLTIDEAAMVIARRPELKQRMHVARKTTSERRLLSIQMTEERAMDIINTDKVDDEIDEESDSEKSGHSSKKKRIKRDVRHLNHKLIEKMLDLDPEHQRAKMGGGPANAAVGAMVSVNVIFKGVDLDKMKHGNSDVILETEAEEVKTTTGEPGADNAG